jgi:glyoxylase-like metal-dependent hydrolase (beta-lactamase superfamily II)
MQRTTRVRLLTAAAFVGCATLAYTQAPQTAAKLETIKLADNLYVIHNDFVPGNTTVLITNEGVLLVDDKYEVDGPNVVAEVKKLTSQPIKYVVNTHHHSDHSGSNALIQKLGAQVVTSEAARKRMVDGKQPGQSNVTFEQKGHIYLGGQTVDLYYFGRAHTDGDIVALFPAQRVLAMGDSYANDPGTPELVDFPGGGSAIEWPKTLTKSLALDFDRAVPGHGTVVPKAEVVKFRDSTQRLSTRVHQMMVAKKTKPEIEKVVRAEFGFQDFHVQMSLDGLMKELK